MSFMTDIVSPQKRSQMMQGIRSQDTTPEIRVRRILHRRGYRYRKGASIDGILPDILLRSYQVAIFVHGCYWHRHRGCKLAYSPRSRVEFWNQKFAANVNRDQRVLKHLLEKNWRVAIIWECATRLPDEHFELLIDDLDCWIKDRNEPLWESPIVMPQRKQK
ncbi:MAG: DNA mismatch endonuclease Vsr [Candidatus Dadabacteria bacterium]|nr:MAG: DNA mismatch endonuclease Vsr [Candidatus Dadabacteria bacterium]